MESPELTCIGCGSRDVDRVGAIPATHVFGGKLRREAVPGGALYRCRECRLGWKWPRLSMERLGELYQDVDFDIWTYDPSSRPDWVATADRLLELREGGDLLDVGCFDGSFFRYLGERTNAWSWYGIELNAQAREEAARAGVEIVGSEASDLPDRTFDAVVAFDLIEHLHDPTSFLEDLARMTRPGGHILISTGNLDAPSWKLMRGRYWYCALAEHLSFLSPEWCRKVAPSLRLEVDSVRLFSHVPDPGWKSRAAEAGRNLLYRTSPGFFRQLRRRGLGGLDVEKYPAMMDYPPLWMTADDQFLVVFSKVGP